MLQLQTPEVRTHGEVRRRIEACMETGNIDQARTVLTEYEELQPELAQQIRTAVIGSYGTSL